MALLPLASTIWKGKWASARSSSGRAPNSLGKNRLIIVQPTPPRIIPVDAPHLIDDKVGDAARKADPAVHRPTDLPPGRATSGRVMIFRTARILRAHD
jgi:hypothetical protein